MKGWKLCFSVLAFPAVHYAFRWTCKLETASVQVRSILAPPPLIRLPIANTNAIGGKAAAPTSCEGGDNGGGGGGGYQVEEPSEYQVDKFSPCEWASNQLAENNSRSPLNVSAPPHRFNPEARRLPFMLKTLMWVNLFENSLCSFSCHAGEVNSCHPTPWFSTSLVPLQSQPA